MTYFDYILGLGVAGYFIESYIASIFISPPSDFFYVPIAIANPKYALLYTTVGFILSVMGGITAYFLGKYGGRPIFNRLYKNKQDVFERYVVSYSKHSFSVVFGAALFIAPYNVCSVASGILYMKFKDFLFASILGRFLRFYTLAFAVYLFGETIKEHWIALGCFFGFVFIPIIWIIELRRLKKKNEA